MSDGSPIVLAGMLGSLFPPHAPPCQPRSSWTYWTLTPCSPAAALTVAGRSIAVVLLTSTGMGLTAAGRMILFSLASQLSGSRLSPA